MLVCRVFWSRSWTYLKHFQKFKRLNSIQEYLKLHRFTTIWCNTASESNVTTHRFGLETYPFMLGMLPANVTASKDISAIPTKEEDDDGGGEAAVNVKCQTKGLKDKKTRRKMWREKKKLKKSMKSDEPLDTLMSELPFALTSPTSWKELGFTNTNDKLKKRKRGEIGGRADSEEDAGKKKKKKESKRPNYFVSIRITNPQISSAVAEVQQAVLQQEPKLSKAMIPIPSLHITLLVTHLANQEQVDLAATVLAAVEPSLAELLGGRGLVLPFSGIGHFRKEVVFIGLAPGEHRHTLESLAELLRSRFEEQGLLEGDCRGFDPHLTIMKLSRAPQIRAQGIKRVDPSLYSDYSERFFGDQPVESVDLCSMLKKKQQDGYYHTETSLQLDLTQRPLHSKRSSGRRSEPDEAELLRVSKRLVEDAINRALQQYKQETLQNGGGPNVTATQPPGNGENTKTDTTANSTSDHRK
ncbi:A-kinase anchor protein 7 isoform X2 [Boleophthalmus pectinirostris]|uniref:A-kinase anchor protein 7 isoform X2 n=1 Tax=Boleophthalmus pectinirostris TaxID=150288 RepID=UPI000A1C609F|nr:A-kinase anchor protein 7 isoform X2 [Boleophthalmus pectinirostris]